MIRKLNRLFQSYAREKRLKIGKLMIVDMNEAKEEFRDGTERKKKKLFKGIIF